MSIQQDMREFEQQLRLLTDRMMEVSGVWNDKQFEDLTRAVSEVAKISKEVFDQGHNCQKSMREFERIVNQK